MWKKGQGLSKEHCDKISEAKRGRKQSATHIENSAAARRGFKQSEKQKNKARKLRAKSFMLTDPNGGVTIINNLWEFCRHNHSVYSGLRRTIISNSPYKGFIIRKMG